ncbi:hypothetical protein RFI_16339 [Reticulomyxa filosa]|uniref:Uncharacterized protein n=1 Tax=Reticulomyxa filosa TaxID=46433 RepID=X6N3N8_RETFI|nr:hypothetical protein RFI_16339 [Reticulomyxa filosa]|eukprot:ETO20870.1 hypothetical protein RFI_16339 [Reticulomyxa filosa]
MRDFVGIENMDNNTKCNLMDFSFHLAVGDLDGAFKFIIYLFLKRSIRNVTSPNVWTSMAKMSVKTRRLDVAEICVSNLSSMSALLFQNSVLCTMDAVQEQEKTLKLVEIAIDLGMYEDAKAMLRECRRYDLLIQLNQALGCWRESVELAEVQEPIYKKGTYYRLGEYFEQLGKTNDSLSALEQSKKFTKLASMLQQQNNLELLQLYIEVCCLLIILVLLSTKILKNICKVILYLFIFEKQHSDSPELFKWWAQYQESIGNVEDSIFYYEKAGDYCSVIRLLCSSNQLSLAEEMVQKLLQKQQGTTKETGTGSNVNDLDDHNTVLSAVFFLGNFFAGNGQDYKKAIHYFKLCKAYDRAIELCKDNQWDELIVSIALEADDANAQNGHTKEIAARYFEEINEFEKAAILFHKAGNINKALELCLQEHLFDTLQNIGTLLYVYMYTKKKVSELNDPTQLEKSASLRIADFLMSNEQQDKAVTLLINAQEYEQAIEMCTKYGVLITDAMADKLTPDEHTQDSQKRRQILLKLGQCLQQQKSYQLACKKYTQAGNKIDAIKCLLKAADPPKAIYYAGMNNGTKIYVYTFYKEIYILVANYLQSLDWQSNEDYSKTIIQFYSLAKAYQYLALFYENMAQREIDDYRDYEKALRALKQAQKIGKKCKDNTSTTTQSDLNMKVSLVDQFVKAKETAQNGQKQQTIEICEKLLNTPNLDVFNCVRIGDVFALLIEFHFSKNEMKEAFQIIQRMQQCNIHLGPVQYFLNVFVYCFAKIIKFNHKSDLNTITFIQYLDWEMLNTICKEVGEDVSKLELETIDDEQDGVEHKNTSPINNDNVSEEVIDLEND